MKVLVIKSSIKGDNSHSNKKVERLIEEYKNNNHEVVVRDVTENPVPIIDSRLLGGLFGATGSEKEIKYHNDLIEEALSADEIVITAPMYNFSVPVQLKAYLDAISRAGKTFKYTESGPIGLLKAKKAIVVSARGGYYFERGFKNMEEYLSAVLGFLGVKEQEFILIEGTAMGENSLKEFKY